MKIIKIRLFSIAILFFFAYELQANTNCQPPKHGINLAGPEFSSEKLPGKIDRDYWFPTTHQLMYYKKHGFNSIRLPVKWPRLQRSLFADLNNAYLNEIKAFLSNAEYIGLNVVLDLHDYARYRGDIIGSKDVPNEAFFDLWQKVALALKNYKALIGYGLMNEPHDTKGLWFIAAQFGVNGIRSVDTHKTIYISGDHWSNSHIWSKINPAPFVGDPQNNVVYEAHLYFDKDFSGRYQKPHNILKTEEVAKRLKSFTDWLAKYHLKGVIGEWGLPANDPNWLPVANEFVNLANKHCLDWYVWAGGAWSKSYPLSLEPNNQKDKALLLFLSNKLKADSNTVN